MISIVTMGKFSEPGSGKDPQDPSTDGGLILSPHFCKEDMEKNFPKVIIRKIEKEEKEDLDISILRVDGD